MIEAGYSVGGAALMLVVTYFWKQMPWSKRYLTAKECANCSLHNDIVVVKSVLLDLAVKAGLPIERYTRLVG